MDDTERAYWLAERCGKLTASRMRDAMDFLKNGNPTKARADYMRELLAERLTGLAVRRYVTPAMEWGLQTECEAWEAYEAATGDLMGPSRFYDHPRIPMCGATPDRESVYDADRLGESKCPTTQTHLGWVMAGVVPDEYKPQMLMQLAATGRRRCTFISYDPRIKDERLRLFVREFAPEPAEIEAIETAAIKFLDEIEALWDQLTTAQAA